MSLRKKRNWKTPLTKLEIKNSVGEWRLKVPKTIILEFLNTKDLYKSPCSISFYSKMKDWNYTEPDTIRWSDHWNFLSKHTGNKIHAKTNIEIPEGIWARGKYDSNNDIFIIELIYEKILLTKEESREIVVKLSMESGRIPSPEIIEKRRELKKLINTGKVFLKHFGNISNVTKISVKQIVLKNEVVIDKDLDGIIQSLFTKAIPDFRLIIDNEEYTEEMLLSENLL